MKSPFNINNLLTDINANELFFQHGTFYRALMGLPEDHLSNKTTPSPPLTDVAADNVMKTALTTLNNQLILAYPNDSEDVRQQKVALLLSDNTLAGAKLASGPTNFLNYVMTKGFKPSHPDGVMPTAFKRMLQVMGPYIFYSEEKKDPLERAFEHATLKEGAGEAPRIFLNHYIDQLEWIKKNRQDSAAHVEVNRLLNNGIIGAIDYAVGLKEKKPLPAQEKEKAENLVYLLLQHPHVQILLMDREESNTKYSISEYIAVRIVGKDKQSAPINEEAIINTFLYGKNWEKHPERFPKKTCIDNHDKHVSPNHSLISPAKWGAGIFALTVVIFACVEGGLWHSSFLNDLFKQALDMDEGESLSADDKGGLLAFSSVAAGLVTGFVTWGIASTMSRPRG